MGSSGNSGSPVKFISALCVTMEVQLVYTLRQFLWAVLDNPITLICSLKACLVLICTVTRPALGGAHLPQKGSGAHSVCADCSDGTMWRDSTELSETGRVPGLSLVNPWALSQD